MVNLSVSTHIYQAVPFHLYFLPQALSPFVLPLCLNLAMYYYEVMYYCTIIIILYLNLNYYDGQRDLKIWFRIFMSRKKRKTSKVEIDLLYRKCRYCKAHRTTHFFDQHETACKAQWIIRNENQQTHLHPTPAIEDAGAVRGIPMDCGELMEGPNAMEIVVETDLLDMSRTGDAEEPIPSEYVYPIDARWR